MALFVACLRLTNLDGQPPGPGWFVTLITL
jgi:hypothetical protein